MMEKRLTAAFWGVLLAIAAWQSPNWWASATDPRVDTGPVPPAVTAAVPAPDKLGPRRTEPPADRAMPYKIDLRDAKQVAEFFPSPESVEEGATFSKNEPGNAGPFDADGMLIMPIDLGKQF
jgi:hypothetical protein